MYRSGKSRTQPQKADKRVRRFTIFGSLVFLLLATTNSVVFVSQTQLNSTMQFSGVPVVQTWSNVPKTTSTSPINVGPGRRETSDLDEETLARAKQQSFVPEPNPPYDVEQDRSVKGNFPLTGQSKSPSALTQDSSKNGGYPHQYRPLAPDILSNGQGLDTSEASLTVTPPDPDIAVGPNHFITVVNLSFAIYDKATGTRLQATSFASWFSAVCSCSSIDLTDPRIAYDSQEGHWLMMILLEKDSTSTSSYLLSVSQTSDPTGAWWNYNLNGTLNYFGTSTWAIIPT
ncbi:hypothetical protein HYR54_13750 [Candidatus Acetothermia bacterium]|nr:hypothetical protein [Candidatus Acetothermia bacterium]MBI3659640.1 hypothetical protein [Candidatus Acetothermia bacterium]